MAGNGTPQIPKGRSRKVGGARLEGEAKGVARGRINLLQELLGVAQSTTAELSAASETELVKFEEDLRNQLRQRGQN